MREILFRGKDTDGIWHEGFYCTFNGETHTIYTGYADRDCGDYYPDYYIVIPETVGQYTEICDKNGTKIFEGDIVTGLFDYELSINAVVEFRDGAFGLLANQHDVEHFHPFTSLCNIEYEVVGNIHDNPELLKNG